MSRSRAEENHNRNVSKWKQYKQTCESHRIRAESARNPLRIRGYMVPLTDCLVPFGYFVVPFGYFVVPLGYFVVPLGYFVVPLGYFVVPLGYFVYPFG